ncbi:MAG: ACT domain-containing protein [Planctomycetota bacterium]
MKPEALTEFSIYLDQRPGELAGVLDAMSAAGVDVVSLAVAEHNGRGLIRLIGEPLDAMRAVCESLMESGVGPVVESGVLAIRIDDRPSAMRDLTTAMADRRINVRYAYLSPSRQDGVVLTRCIFRVDDLEGVRAQIEAIDWPGNGHVNGTADH